MLDLEQMPTIATLAAKCRQLHAITELAVLFSANSSNSREDANKEYLALECIDEIAAEIEVYANILDNYDSPESYGFKVVSEEE